MRHWRDSALARDTLVFRGNRISHTHGQLSKLALHLGIGDFIGSTTTFDDDGILVLRTSPRNWTASVISKVHRNASTGQSFRAAQFDSTVDFLAVRIAHHRAVVETLLAVAAVARFLRRIHLLTFPVQFTFEVALGQLFDLVLPANWRTRGTALALFVLVDAVLLRAKELRTVDRGTGEGCWRSFVIATACRATADQLLVGFRQTGSGLVNVSIEVALLAVTIR